VNRACKTAAAAVCAALFLALIAPQLRANPDETTSAAESKGSSRTDGFVYIPAGDVNPGCTMADYKRRANNDVQKQLFIFDVWGRYPKPVQLDGYYFGKYEVTNAQFKLYLDREFSVTVTTNGQETLKSLAETHIRHFDEPVAEEWKSIYALNWAEIYAGMKGKMKPRTQEEKDAGKKEEPIWNQNWTSAKPGEEIKNVHLPEGIELRFYSHPVPKHWYGWCKLSGLSTGKEYCDVRAAPQDAFIVPDTEMFKTLRLRAMDFRAYPIRDLAPHEYMAFAEWAGCTLPSEYQFERAARSDSPNTRQHPGKSDWKHGKQPSRFAYGENKKSEGGPMAVDDPSVAEGDTDFGARHVLGNVWELTRTFWDVHPYVTPRPDDSITQGLFNYALIAKGGSWGSGYRQVQISVRTGMFAHGLDLKMGNRADSLGVRLVRHPEPGYDLASHTIRRMAFDANLGRWSPPPHGFAMKRMAGADITHNVPSDAKSGYTYVQDRARGVAFVPYWAAPFSSSIRGKFQKWWKNVKTDKSEGVFLGVLRSDVPLRAGTPWKEVEWRKVVAQRKAHAKWTKDLKTLRGKKKEAHLENEPPNPPPADKYEAATVKQREKAGVWHENEIGAGEWNVVYWYGFIGLTGRAKSLPPLAILMFNPMKDAQAERKMGPNSQCGVLLRPEKDEIELSIVFEEVKNLKKPQSPPRAQQSDLWALCETLENGWPGRKVNNLGWRFRVTLPTVKDALKKGAWNTEAPVEKAPEKDAAEAENDKK